MNLFGRSRTSQQPAAQKAPTAISTMAAVDPTSPEQVLLTGRGAELQDLLWLGGSYDVQMSQLRALGDTPQLSEADALNAAVLEKFAAGRELLSAAAARAEDAAAERDRAYRGSQMGFVAGPDPEAAARRQQEDEQFLDELDRLRQELMVDVTQVSDLLRQATVEREQKKGRVNMRQEAAARDSVSPAVQYFSVDL